MRYTPLVFLPLPFDAALHRGDLSRYLECICRIVLSFDLSGRQTPGRAVWICLVSTLGDVAAWTGLKEGPTEVFHVLGINGCPVETCNAVLRERPTRLVSFWAD